MSYEQLMESVDNLAAVNANLKTTVQGVQTASEEARDAAQAHAIEALAGVTEVQTAIIQVPLDGKAAAEAVVAETLNELATDAGGTMVATKAPLAGAVKRSIEARFDTFITIEDFGGIGDGTYHPLSERYTNIADARAAYPGVPLRDLTESIDYAATYACFKYAAKKRIILLGGVYVITNTIEMDFPPRIIGTARNREWNALTDSSGGFNLTSAAFLTYGNFPKVHTAKGVTDGSNNGGMWVNPDSVHTTDGKYKLAHYYNADGTPKLFSVAFKFKFGSNSANWSNFSIVKGFNGTLGYTTRAKGWGDDVDVGVYMDNSRHNTFEGVDILGYWNLNGLLIRSGALDTEEDYVNSGVFSGAEENKFTNCVFQGWKSVGNRSIDMYKVIEITSTYIGIPEGVGLPFLSHMRLRSSEFGGQFMTISSIENVAGVTRLYTVGSPVGKIAVNETVSPSYHGNGVAGTVFKNCRARGMYHQAKYRCSDPWHTVPLEPSACMEVSGTRIRGLRWETCKTQTIEDINIHAHQCIDLMMPGLRLESDPDANGVGGSHMISTNKTFTNYARDCFRVRYDAEQTGADMRPNAPSETFTKFPLSTGMWMPTVAGVDGRYGVFIGGFADNNKIAYFNNGGFTLVLKADDADFAGSGVIRHGVVTQVDSMMTLQFSYRAATPTYTTGDGGLVFDIPGMPSGFTTPLMIPIFFQSLLGPKQVFVEITAGDKVAKLYYIGPNGLATKLTAKLAAASGALIHISGVLNYQVDVTF
jgi:hypothetical protein